MTISTGVTVNCPYCTTRNDQRVYANTEENDKLQYIVCRGCNSEFLIRPVWSVETQVFAITMIKGKDNDS